MNHNRSTALERSVLRYWGAWAWSNRSSPSKWAGLGSPLAASSVYGDLTCSVHTVNNLCMFNCQCHFYLCNRGPYVRLAFVPDMLSSWNKDIIINMMYKSLTDIAPDYMADLFNKVSDTHNRYLRSVGNDLLRIPYSRTCYYDRSFTIQGDKQWNSLPRNIRNSSS